MNITHNFSTCSAMMIKPTQLPW